jgi:hypothetical protein
MDSLPPIHIFPLRRSAHKVVCKICKMISYPRRDSKVTGSGSWCDSCQMDLEKTVQSMTERNGIRMYGGIIVRGDEEQILSIIIGYI